jgi:hypothetical protein
MIKAIVKNGTIEPLETIPTEWYDGQEVVVQETHGDSRETPDELDRWYRELDALCVASDPEDDERLRAALAEAHEQAKAVVRRQMGLP